jgi:hypothetical protein
MAHSSTHLIRVRPIDNAGAERTFASGLNRQPGAKYESGLRQPQGQLTLIAILVPFDKIRDRRGNLAHLQIAATSSAQIERLP